MAHNVKYHVDGDKLVIEVDISSSAVESAPQSSTGKTNLVASTGGYEKLGITVAGQSLSLAVTVTAK